MSPKTVVITGGSSGIGRAAAEMFARRGDTVYDLSRHDAGTPGVLHMDADVTRPESLCAAMETIAAVQGRIDVLICCAGMGVSGAAECIAEPDLHRQFDVNLYGTIHAVRAVLPHMRAQKSGSILCVSSVAAVYAIPFQAFYSASKAAVNAFADALRTEVQPFGIRVCAVMPGDIATGFTAARCKTTAGSDIYPCADAAVAKMEQDEKNGMSPERVAAQLIRLADKKSLAPLYTVGGSYRFLVFLRRLFPGALASKIVGQMYR